MLKSINRILVPIDYSTHGFEAAWLAFSIARSMGASLTLIHIHLREEALRELVAIDKDEVAVLSEESFGEALEAIVGDPSYENLKIAIEHSVVELTTVSYHPATEICNYATEKNVDLIVMGSRIHTKLEDLLLGNVSTRVLQKSPCPVTIAH
ncbi:MAG: universal stress protein [Proteobacteria bacterium]|jgi:nucleotide-binding universal stress UspA family protein|nr:universal stress protein [Pseudomonadota bacterium]